MVADFMFAHGCGILYHAMPGKRLEQAGRLVNSLNVERPYSEPGLLLGTSAFTANGWPGVFYPPGMKQSDFLSYYANQFITVEIESTYYRTPSESTVTNWYERTPPEFIFSAKVPQVVTHEKVLVDCEAEFEATEKDAVRASTTKCARIQ